MNDRDCYREFLQHLLRLNRLYVDAIVGIQWIANNTEEMNTIDIYNIRDILINLESLMSKELAGMPQPYSGESKYHSKSLFELLGFENIKDVMPIMENNENA